MPDDWLFNGYQMRQDVPPLLRPYGYQYPWDMPAYDWQARSQLQWPQIQTPLGMMEIQPKRWKSPAEDHYGLMAIRRF